MVVKVVGHKSTAPNISNPFCTLYHEERDSASYTDIINEFDGQSKRTKRHTN